MPAVNAEAVVEESVLVPTRIANACCFEVLAEATRMATANEKTIPTLANVRSSPETMPNSSPGAAFITAALFDGEQQPDPIAPTSASRKPFPRTLPLEARKLSTEVMHCPERAGHASPEAGRSTLATYPFRGEDESIFGHESRGPDGGLRDD